MASKCLAGLQRQISRLDVGDSCLDDELFRDLLVFFKAQKPDKYVHSLDKKGLKLHP